MNFCHGKLYHSPNNIMKFNIHDVTIKVHTSVSVLVFIPDALVDIATLFSLDHSYTMLLGFLFSDEDSYCTLQVKLILPPTVIVISYGTTVTSNFNVPANEIYSWFIRYLPLFEICRRGYYNSIFAVPGAGFGVDLGGGVKSIHFLSSQDFPLSFSSIISPGPGG